MVVADGGPDRVFADSARTGRASANLHFWRSSAGPRANIKKNIAEIKETSLTFSCTVDASDMVAQLTGTDIGLLRFDPTTSSYALQHDLVARALGDRKDISSDESWHQTLQDQQTRLTNAHGYSESELFGAQRPVRKKIRVAELRFWDHKLLAYAAEHGFFSRLGIEAEVVEYPNNMSAHELAAELEVDEHTMSVYSYPGNLMSAEEHRVSTDLVVLNMFEGYAVVGNRNIGLTDDKSASGWDRLQRVLHVHLDSLKFIAEDVGARNFFVKFLRMMSDDPTLAADAWHSRIQSAIHVSSITGSELLNSVVDSTKASPCLAIITAPTWAVSRMMQDDIETFMDHRSASAALSSSRGHSPEKSGLRENLAVFNVMHVQMPRVSRLAADEQAQLMRIAAVGIFTASFAWAHDEQIGMWIRNRWINTMSAADTAHKDVTASVFLDVFRRSYRFVPFLDQFDNYFDPKNGVSFSTPPLAIDQSTKEPTAWWLYRALLEACSEYRQLAIQVECRRLRNGTTWPPDVLANIERAHRHAEIFNYYDARQFIRDVWLSVSSNE